MSECFMASNQHQASAEGARDSQDSRAELDLEVKDPNLIFESVWAQLEEEFGTDKLRFPREVI